MKFGRKSWARVNEEISKLLSLGIRFWMFETYDINLTAILVMVLLIYFEGTRIHTYIRSHRRASHEPYN